MRYFRRGNLTAVLQSGAYCVCYQVVVNVYILVIQTIL